MEADKTSRCLGGALPPQQHCGQCGQEPAGPRRVCRQQVLTAMVVHTAKYTLPGGLNQALAHALCGMCTQPQSTGACGKSPVGAGMQRHNMDEDHVAYTPTSADQAQQQEASILLCQPSCEQETHAHKHKRMQQEWTEVPQHTPNCVYGRPKHRACTTQKIAGLQLEVGRSFPQGSNNKCATLET